MDQRRHQKASGLRPNRSQRRDVFLEIVEGFAGWLSAIHRWLATSLHLGPSRLHRKPAVEAEVQEVPGAPRGRGGQEVEHPTADSSGQSRHLSIIAGSPHLEQRDTHNSRSIGIGLASASRNGVMTKISTAGGPLRRCWLYNSRNSRTELTSNNADGDNKRKAPQIPSQEDSKEHDADAVQE